MVESQSKKVVAGMFLLFAGIIGCTMKRVESPNELIGVFKYFRNSQSITLNIHSDGCYTETIDFSSGDEYEIQGKWQLRKGGELSLDQLWIPKSFYPKGNIDRGYTDYPNPVHVSTWPVRRWGKLCIVISDDDNLVIKKQDE
jgi:hypothetical protein